MGVGRALFLHLALLGALGRAVAPALSVLGRVVLGAEVFGDFGRIDVISVLVSSVGSRWGNKAKSEVNKVCGWQRKLAPSIV